MGISQSADGWTIITPSGSFQNGFNTGAPGSTSTTMIIFVSNSTGKDSGDGGYNSAIQGSLAQPYRTIAAGLARMRNGSPDWLLLKNGDTWTNEQFGSIFIGGMNATERMVFSSYDSAAANNPPIPNPGTGGSQPLIKVAFNTPGCDWMSSFFAVTGLNFYCHTKDPLNGAYISSPGQNQDGVAVAPGSSSTYVLMEDLTSSFFHSNLTADSINFGSSNVTIRRCRALDSWDNSGNHGVGIHSATCVPNLLIEENLVDLNGYNPTADPGGISLAHNLYLSGGYTPPGDQASLTFYSDLTFRGNTMLRANFNDNNRVGGTLYNNYWGPNIIQNTCATNYSVTNPTGTNVISYNVFHGGTRGDLSSMIEIAATGPDGQVPGGYFYNKGPMNIQHNIFTGAGGINTVQNAIAIGFNTGEYNGLLTEGNNISWKATTNAVGCGTGLDPPDTYTALGGDIVDLAGTTAVAHGWPHPTRTITSYDSEVLGGPGTIAHFAGLARAQHRGNWNGLLMAESVNDYVRQGFGLAMIGSAYAGFTPGVPVLMPQICM